MVMLSEPLSMVVCNRKSVEKLKGMSVQASEHCLYTVKGRFFLTPWSSRLAKGNSLRLQIILLPLSPDSLSSIKKYSVIPQILG